jgi:hypothetical protein
VLVHLQGGLGNQLFQLAFTIPSVGTGGGRVSYCGCRSSDPTALQNFFGSRQVVFDRNQISFFWRCRLHQRALDRICLSLSSRAPKVAKYLALISKISNFGIEDQNLCKDRMNVFGYFQSRLPAPEEISALRSALGLSSANTHPRQGKLRIVVHVRRNGFTGTSFGGLTAEYYKEAIEILDTLLESEGSPSGLSGTVIGDADSISEISHGLKSRYIENWVFSKSSQEDDWWSMCSATHLVASNSTFCYWAAILASEKIRVIAPVPYYYAEPYDQVRHPDWIECVGHFD